MATDISTLINSKKPHGFMTLLSSAACEWFLMFLLFVDAALSYLLTKFAQYCGLNTPCLLCSRLECGFGQKQPGCYWNLLCSDHREEISCLVSCSIHRKFADVNGMCEECLVPIVEQSGPECGSYRLLVGKSWVDVDKSVLQTLLLNKSVRLGSPYRKVCSCCNKAWKAKTNAERLLELNSVVNVAAKANVKPPLPRVPGRSRFFRRDSLKRLRDKYSGKGPGAGSSGDDASLREGNLKRKISSHSDTEILLSEDEGSQKIRSCETCTEPDYDAEYDANFPLQAVAYNAALEKVIFQGCEVKPQPHLLDLRHLENVGSLSSDAFTGSIRNWEFSNNKLNPFSELISFDDSVQQPDVAGGSFGISAETSKSDVPQPQMPAFSGLSELLSLSHALPLNNSTKIVTKILVAVDAGRICETGDASAAKHTGAAVGNSSEGSCSLESTNMHRTDASMQTDESRELLDEQGLEQTNARDSAAAEEHLRSQTPLASTSELSVVLKDNHLLVNDNRKECSVHNDSCPQVPQISAMLRENYSSNESLDGISVSDIEGESIVDRLKCQILLDQSYINSLCKELEEERNAASIAANQAMAMITRLQEEKAALHMEALQYLRMMEEQAEYDMEALARTNDLLAEREKELQDLEYEVEFYRENVGVDEVACAPDCSAPAKVLKANGNDMLANSGVSSLEDMKVYVSQCLKKLEKKLHQSCQNGKSDNVCNGLNYERVKATNGDKLLNQDNTGNIFQVPNGILNSSNGTLTNDQENDCPYENQGEMSSAALEKEIVVLRERLEALETDCNLLKFAADSIQSEKDGLQFVQEIAHQLQEMRKMEFRSDNCPSILRSCIPIDCSN